MRVSVGGADVVSGFLPAISRFALVRPVLRVAAVSDR
jgi:hypothetical protein